MGLYGFVPEIRIFFIALLLGAIIFQTMRLFLLISHREYRIPFMVILYEACMNLYLIQVFMRVAMTLLQRNIHAEYFGGFILIDLILIILGFWLAWKYKTPDFLICSLLLFVALHFYAIANYEYLYLYVDLYLVFRSMVMLDREWRKSRESITRMSIKEVVNLFPGGILYATGKGQVLISNPTMNQLLSDLNVSIAENAECIWNNLMQLQNNYDVEVQTLEDKLLLRIRNSGSWLYSNDTIVIKQKKYRQLLAVDITEEDVLTRNMQKTNIELMEMGQELSWSIRNIDRLEKEREILRIKTKVHDVLGHRLSIISRLLEKDLDIEDMVKSFKPILTDLIQSITENIDTTPQEEVSSLIQSFALIETALQVIGDLPGDGKVATVFAGIIRECATNAVRHANASNIEVKLQENKTHHLLMVSNDGALPSDPIVEGGGLQGIRKQLEELSGELKVESLPQFHITIQVPKHRKEDIYG